VIVAPLGKFSEEGAHPASQKRKADVITELSYGIRSLGVTVVGVRAALMAAWHWSKRPASCMVSGLMFFSAKRLNGTPLG